MADDSLIPNPLPNPIPNPLFKPRHLGKWIKAHPKKAALIGLVILLALGLAGYLAGRYLHRSPTTELTVNHPPKPKTKPSPLTGVEVAPELADRPIRAVVVENHPDARPQSGLSQAGVVYEALAEGGITRFLTFYLDGKPPVIGPVRSLRPYFESWTLEFGAPIAHVGGDADAIAKIGPLHIKDMNEFYNGGYFYRSRDRIAPHNAYTTTKLMDALLKLRGWNKPATFTPSPRKDDDPPKAPATARRPVINVRYSYSDFDVKFVYNPAGNDYKRFLAGVPHIDRNTGKQIRVKNVIVEYMPTTYGHSRAGEKETFMQTVGKGTAIVFRDGGAVVGTWSKASNNSRTKLLDPNGKEIPLDRGNSWYCIVPPTGSVGY